MPTQVRSITKRIILQLYGDGNPNKAILASLRGAPTLTSPRAQPVWPVFFATFDADALSQDGRPTPEETAVFTALRLYAIHQQGNSVLVYGDSRAPEQPGLTVFAALAQLRRNPDLQVALDRRVQAILATTNLGSVRNELTHLINLIKAKATALRIDYPALAADLDRFQRSYEQANEVRLRWGQAYYHQTESATQPEGK